MTTLDITTFSRILLFVILSISCQIPGSPSHAGTYPLQVDIIDKVNTRYDSPENTYAAIISAMLSEDIEWYYSCFTMQAAENMKKLYDDNNIDIQSVFESVKTIKKMEVLEKGPYGDGAYLLLKVTDQDGSVMQGPSVFFKEDGMWKSTPEIPADDPLLEKLTYTPPPSILTPYQLSFFPNRWNLSWYNWIKRKTHANKSANQFTKNSTILCILTEDDVDIHISDIDLETIRLNGTVSPQPWHHGNSKTFSWQSQLALVIDPTSTEKEHYHQQFSSWRKNLKKPLETNGPFLLARFNKFEAMQSIGEINADTQYEVTISGKLRDGREFEAKSKIMTVTHTPPKKKWKKDTPPDHNTLMKFWWN